MSVEFLVVPESVTAGRFGTWQYDVIVRNPGSYELTINQVEWRVRRRDGRPPLHAMAALSGSPNPSLFFVGAKNGQVGPGQSVRGRAAHFSHWEKPTVEWRISVVPEGDGHPLELVAQVDLEPAELDPFYYVPDCEAVLAAPDGPGPFPALLILHPYGGSARAMGWAALEAANNGWVGMAVSQPGFGGSAGPWDYAGPASQEAASAALDYLRAHPQVDADSIGMWGISMGAMLSGLVAARSSIVAAVALQAGLYDLEAHHSQGGLKWLESEGVGAAPSDQAWLTSRNVMANAHAINCPTLILHGAEDRIAPLEHAQRLDVLLRGAGKPVELVVLDKYGHGLPPLRVWSKHLIPFFQSIFAA